MGQRTRSRQKRGPVRYAVMGLGHIAQTAVIPAFQNAKRNSQLTALVSDDETKLKEIAQLHGIEHTFTQFDDLAASGVADAVYIALPNHLHCEYTVRAAEVGLHVLCEKPMAVTVAECEKMLYAAEAADVKLMIAYRLHFERANMRAVELVHSGALGDVRAFSSVFAVNIQEGNIRLERELGGGSLYDIGIYCINAARYLFRVEPTEVTAFSESRDDPRFAKVDEMTSAVLRFPGNRLATFVSSFGTKEVSNYQLIGTAGNLRVEPAYDYYTGLKHYLTVNGTTTKKAYPKRDQFAPELTYFSNCILRDQMPEPGPYEGLCDVAIVEALYASAQSGKSVALDLKQKQARPDIGQAEFHPPVDEPELVHAVPPQPE